MENTDQILDAPPVSTSRLEYAGFWIRTGAYFLDALLLGIVNIMLNFALKEVAPPLALSVLNLVLGIAYFALMEASEYQATPGKMAVGIKVGDKNGDRISLSNAIGRYFAKIISTVLLFIGFMMVGWDERKQGIHDKLADTFVFYGKQ